MSKFDVKVEGEKLNIGLDLNEDGEKLLEASIHLPEAIQEILKKGEMVEGAKLVDFEFGLGGIKLSLDTDQDGEKLVEININLSEALDESGILK